MPKQTPLIALIALVNLLSVVVQAKSFIQYITKEYVVTRRRHHIVLILHLLDV